MRQAAVLAVVFALFAGCGEADSVDDGKDVSVGLDAMDPLDAATDASIDVGSETSSDASAGFDADGSTDAETDAGTPILPDDCVPYRMSPAPTLPEISDPDLNGDGEADLITIEVSEDDPGESHLAVYAVIGGVPTSTAIYLSSDSSENRYYWNSHGDLDCDGIDDLEVGSSFEAQWGDILSTTFVLGSSTATQLVAVGGANAFVPRVWINVDDSCAAEAFGFQSRADFTSLFGWVPQVRSLTGAILASDVERDGDRFAQFDFPVAGWEDANCDGYHDVEYAIDRTSTATTTPHASRMYFGGPAEMGSFDYSALTAREPYASQNGLPFFFGFENEFRDVVTTWVTFPNPVLETAWYDDDPNGPDPGPTYLVTESCPSCAGVVHVFTSTVQYGPLIAQPDLVSSTGTTHQYFGVFLTRGSIAGMEMLAFVRPDSEHGVYGVIEVRRFDPINADVFLPGVHEIASPNFGDAYGQPRFVTYNGVDGVSAYSRDIGRYEFHAWIDAANGFDPAVSHTF